MRWPKATSEYEPEPELVDMADAGGFVVREFHELPAVLQAHILARKVDHLHPAEQEADYDELNFVF